MIPSSRPILPPVAAPPAGENPAAARHAQPRPLSTLQTQSSASNNTRSFGASRYRFSSTSGWIDCNVGFVFRLTLTDLEDGPQAYEAMYNIQAGAQQAVDSGTRPPSGLSAGEPPPPGISTRSQLV